MPEKPPKRIHISQLQPKPANERSFEYDNDLAPETRSMISEYVRESPTSISDISSLGIIQRALILKIPCQLPKEDYANEIKERVAAKRYYNALFILATLTQFGNRPEVSAELEGQIKEHLDKLAEENTAESHTYCARLAGFEVQLKDEHREKIEEHCKSLLQNLQQPPLLIDKAVETAARLRVLTGKNVVRNEVWIDLLKHVVELEDKQDMHPLLYYTSDLAILAADKVSFSPEGILKLSKSSMTQDSPPPTQKNF